ncbi:DUF397 domain-containing protein [Kitasatospora sp. NPDC004240]
MSAVLNVDPAGDCWRKSSYSGAQSECVEIAVDAPDAVPVRDSKDPSGPVLRFSPVAWASFIVAVKDGTMSSF